MNNKRHTNSSNAAHQNNDIETAYADFLTCFYDKGDSAKAMGLAGHLEKLLTASLDYQGSIREQEIRSLIAEARGDLGEAARYREAEIRKVLELHSLTANTPHWPAVAQRYDYGDVSDRLDLLAIIYDKLGQTDSAINVLRESKQYCEAHDLRFDAQDILDELEAPRRNTITSYGRHRKHLVKRGGKSEMRKTGKRQIHGFKQLSKA